jgi:heme exporter protein A
LSAALRAERVTCVRGGRTLFTDLSFALQPGDAAVVSGPNGIGKSSLVRIAAGLLAQRAGAVTAVGRRALLTETAALDAELPLGKALTFWARIDGAASIDDALDAFGLSALAEVPVRLLSTGQRKRAGLARVAASAAAIWLLDEPANGLDAAATAMLEVAIERHRGGGGIVLLASHLPIRVDGAQPVDLVRAP